MRCARIISSITNTYIDVQLYRYCVGILDDCLAVRRGSLPCGDDNVYLLNKRTSVSENLFN